MKTTKTQLTARWQTICIVGYSGTVNSRDENRAAHGGVRMLQARRRGPRAIQGREVNSNGRHKEVGEPFALAAELLACWESLGRQRR